MSPRAQPRGTLANWGNAFLPGAYAGSYVNLAEMKPDAVIRDLKNTRLSTPEQQQQIHLLEQLNRKHLARLEKDQDLEASIAAMEMAFRMQATAPIVQNLNQETKATQEAYGLNDPTTQNYGKLCLMARRFIESGVRFVQVSHSYKWDQHSNLKGDLTRNCKEVDQPIAALISDLKARGLLEDTLVWWGGEFGRTPVAQGGDGRDHAHGVAGDTPARPVDLRASVHLNGAVTQWCDRGRQRQGQRGIADAQCRVQRTVSPKTGHLDGDLGEFVGIEEIGRTQVLITLADTGFHRGHPDLETPGYRAAGGDAALTGDVGEPAVDRDQSPQGFTAELD
jgi:hypothetical protein